MFEEILHMSFPRISDSIHLFLQGPVLTLMPSFPLTGFSLFPLYSNNTITAIGSWDYYAGWDVRQYHYHLRSLLLVSCQLHDLNGLHVALKMRITRTACHSMWKSRN
jgi:hypothetical protein